MFNWESNVSWLRSNGRTLVLSSVMAIGGMASSENNTQAAEGAWGTVYVDENKIPQNLTDLDFNAGRNGLPKSNELGVLFAGEPVDADEPRLRRFVLGGASWV